MSEKVNSISASLQEKLDKAVALYAQDHVNEAYPLFQELAEAGIPRAFYFLGEYYRDGRQVKHPRNEKLGFRYHHQGAKKGEVLCQLNLAYEEKTINENVMQAVLPALFSLAQAGDPMAQDELGDALNNLDHIDDAALCHLDTTKEAEYWMLKAAETGYWRAFMSLACAYKGGGNIAKDLNKAIQWHKALIRMNGDHVAYAVELLGLVYEAQGDYDGKFRESMKWAAEGYDWPMYYVAECYDDGKGATQSTEQAMEWYQKAYDCHGKAAGYAATRLGVLYDDQEDMENAVAWYRKGVEEGFIAAMFNLGRLYRIGSGVPEDWEKAIEWFKKAYAFHVEWAGLSAYWIAGIYSDLGKTETYLEWLKKSADEGCDEAMMDLGWEYEAEDASVEMQAKAMEWYQKAYECRGEAAESAAARLATLYEEQENIDKAIEWYQKIYELHGELAGKAANSIGVIMDEQNDAEKAFDWFLKGAEEGFDTAMVNLGDMYRTGRGVSKDLRKAKEWFEKAWEFHGKWAGSAAYQLAKVYLEQRKMEKRLEWLNKGAEAGYDEAMLDLGLSYDGENPSAENLAKAMEWYQKAYAAHGRGAEEATFLIALAYDKQEQPEKAFDWYEKSAEAGTDIAMLRLALAYERGRGVPKNREKAIEWFQKTIDCHESAEEPASYCLKKLLEAEEGK